MLYVRSCEPGRRRRRRVRTRSAREPAPMAAAQEKASACCRAAAPARVAGGPTTAVPVRAIAASPAGKVVSMATGSGERVVASAAGAGGAVIEEIAAVEPTTAKASSKGMSACRGRHLSPSLSLCFDLADHMLIGS